MVLWAVGDWSYWKGSIDMLWPEVSGNAIESRVFARDNWNYRE